MRLGFIAEPRASNSNYRAIFPMRALERLGHEVLWPAQLERDTPLSDLLTCDLVHCFRRPDRSRDLKQLAQRGVAVSFDNDDDFSAADMVKSASGKLEAGGKVRVANTRRFTEMLRLVKAADLTTTPARCSPRSTPRRRPTAWRSSTTTSTRTSPGSVSRPLMPASFSAGWPAPSTSRIWRDCPSWMCLAGCSTRIPSCASSPSACAWRCAPSATSFVPRWVSGSCSEHGRFDIGIAPLSDTPFNQARSSVKLKEYAAVGAAWLASPVGGYRDMGAREGGRLVGDEGWFDALDGLIRARFKRRRLSRQALKWAHSQTIDRFASRWEEEFSLTIERAHARRPALTDSPTTRSS